MRLRKEYAPVPGYSNVVDMLPPVTLIQFARRFPTDEACLEFLAHVRWPTGFVCPKCGAIEAWYLPKRRLWECVNGHQISVTAGTVLHGTRTPLTTWFYAAYLMTALTPGISALQLQRQLGINRYETATRSGSTAGSGAVRCSCGRSAWRHTRRTGSRLTSRFTRQNAVVGGSTL